MMKKLPKSLTRVTTFSKVLAGILFVLFPFLGFVIGVQYGQMLTIVATAPKENVSIYETKKTPTPTIFVEKPTAAAMIPVQYSTPPGWSIVDSYVWGPGGEVEGEGRMWKLKISLPPDLEHISSGSEEFLQTTSEPRYYWDTLITKSNGSRRETYLRRIEAMDGYVDNKPASKCELKNISEYTTTNGSPYLKVDAHCVEKTSIATDIFEYDHSAYLYTVGDMLFVIVRSQENNGDAIMDKYIADILPSISLE